MARDQVTVEGVKEAQKAFAEVKKGLDFAAMNEAAANELIPDIRTLSRKDTGAMAAGFDVFIQDKGAAFTNSEFYWTFQEFGTAEVAPTNAILKSWERNEKDVLKAYDEAIKSVAEDAGFEQ